MDISIELVKRHCSRYFESYASCVDKFPYTWHLDCDKQKAKLNKCAEGHPTIQNIKYGCVDSFEKYDECISTHPSKAELCGQFLNAFKKCAKKFYTAEDIKSVSDRGAKS
ncbi:coiled-coil-helix-coiled-coil-helix domain-containing protein 5-like [Liolophura sinensis]|uniref:coiled-coil-helix-coiled-coil-helix domain-containing protein 5-like n=1 Tax=Liolophura sinensis TaxID=3198878 RepID=UPI00315887CB